MSRSQLSAVSLLRKPRTSWICAEFIHTLYRVEDHVVSQSTQQDSVLTRFIRDVLRGALLRHKSTLYRAMYYLNRLKSRHPHCCSRSGRRMFLAALMTGAKYDIDHAYANKQWASIAPISSLCALREINQLERQFLARLQWRLTIDPAALQKFEEDVWKRFGNVSASTEAERAADYDDTAWSGLPAPASLTSALPVQLSRDDARTQQTTGRSTNYRVASSSGQLPLNMASAPAVLVPFWQNSHQSWQTTSHVSRRLPALAPIQSCYPSNQNRAPAYQQPHYVYPLLPGHREGTGRIRPDGTEYVASRRAASRMPMDGHYFGT